MIAVLRMSVLLGLLAACGADGPPERPMPQPAKTGLTLTGEARIGVTSQ